MTDNQDPTPVPPVHLVKIPADYNNWDKTKQDEWCKQVWEQFTGKRTAD